MQRGLYMNCATADSYLVSVSVAVSGVADSWQCTTDSAFTLWASISGTADSLLPPSPQWLAALPDVGRTITNAIKAEMQLHTSTGNWGTCLEKVHAYLMSATSVEAERAFSAAGVLCTKLRSQLADNSIDTMCFLRSYYMKRCTCN